MKNIDWTRLLCPLDLCNFWGLSFVADFYTTFSAAKIRRLRNELLRESQGSTAWVAEPFSKWGGAQVHVKKTIENFVISIGNCDVASTEI